MKLLSVIACVLLIGCATVQPVASGYTAGVKDSKALEVRPTDSRQTAEIKILGQNILANADREIAEAQNNAQDEIKILRKQVDSAKKAVILWRVIAGVIIVISSIAIVYFRGRDMK